MISCFILINLVSGLITLEKRVSTAVIQLRASFDDLVWFQEIDFALYMVST